MLDLFFPENLLNKKIKVNNGEISIGEIIQSINFTETVDHEIKQCLSPYSTFFDGVNFYYDNNILKQYKYIEKMQIIMNEILNFLSLYFTSNRKMTQLSADKHMNRNLLCLYHLGLVDKQVWYSQSTRGHLIQKYVYKYGELDVIVFNPNEGARQYLNNSLLVNNLGIFSPVKQIVESYDTVYIEMDDKELRISEYKGIHYTYRNNNARHLAIALNKRGKLVKSLTEEFFMYLRKNNIRNLDPKLLSGFIVEENVIDDNIHLFDLEKLSRKKFSPDFIKKNKEQLSLATVLYNNRHLSLQFVEQEMLSMYNQEDRKNNREYELLCIIIARNYNLAPDFINKYYDSPSLITEIIRQNHKVNISFLDSMFSGIPHWLYYKLIQNQDLNYDFIIKYINELNTIENLFNAIKQYQYRNLTEEQINHVEAIELMESLSSR